MDGVFGPLVIRQEDAAEPHLGLYDHDLPEHTVIINDWLVELSINRFTNHHYAGGDNKPASMLIDRDTQNTQVAHSTIAHPFSLNGHC